MKFVKINNSKELHSIYTPDKWTGKIDYINGVETEVFACVKPMIIEREGVPITTSEWFITSMNNELIYDVGYNRWVNLDMFDRGESYCSEIYYVSLEEQHD